MAFESLDISLPDDFNNLVRLFPLPNVVLYPGVLQGLHIFEPRYLDLLKDASETDSLITMAVLKTDSFASMLGDQPTIHSTVCIGKIVTQARLEDGRHNILLIGSARARLVKELETKDRYRVAQVQLLDETCEGSEEDIAPLRRELIAKFGLFAKTNQLSSEPIRQILANQLPFGLLVDLIAYALSGPLQKQIEVLECTESMRRAQLVLGMLDGHLETTSVEPGPDFPPPFSLN